MYTENAVWLYNQGWIYQNRHCLNESNAEGKNINDVIYDLNRGHIKHVFLNVGVWVGYNHSSWIPDPVGQVFIFAEFTDAEITRILNRLHAGCPGLKVHAWLINDGDFSSWVQDPTKWAGMDAQILSLLAKGFDAYHDDIESTGDIAGDSVARENWIAYVNHLKPLCDGVGKMSSIATGLDWVQGWNMKISIDINANMFLGMVNGGVGTIFEDVKQRRAFWNENFGNSIIFGPDYSGNTPLNPPISPIQVGIYNATSLAQVHPLDFGLDWIAEELATADPHVNLSGFAVWIYEYMDECDWKSWIQWIESDCTKRARNVTVKSLADTTELPVVAKIDGRWGTTTPYTDLYYDGNHTISMPVKAEIANHSVIVGKTEHVGGEGYNVFAYAAGPYTITASTPVSSIYLYTPVAGKVKVAIYNSRVYDIAGWVTTNIHPDQLIVQSQETVCEALTWNKIDLPLTTLPAGDYFIAIKGDTQGIIGTSNMGEWQKSDQYTESEYAVDFPQTYTPMGTMGNYASAYIPSAPPQITTYPFNSWSDGVTSATRTANITSNAEFTAIYGGTPPPPPPNLLPFVLLAGVGTVLYLGMKK